jgi:hypothetical protein
MDFNTVASVSGAFPSVHSIKLASERDSLSVRRRCFRLPQFRVSKTQAGVVTPLESLTGENFRLLSTGVRGLSFPPGVLLGGASWG